MYHSLHIQVPPTSRMKTVLTVHDCRYLALPTLYAVHEVEEYRRWMKISLNRVERVATVSEFTRQELLSHFPIPEERIRVIHNGFSPYVPEGDDGEERIEYFMSENQLPQTYLLFAGALDPRKKLSRLIQAFAQSGFAVSWMEEPAPDPEFVKVDARAVRADSRQFVDAGARRGSFDGPL